ncbi:MAG: amidohydrolase family protein, partial [Thermoleophilia bacterium]|nr:amidohydrolase family protein [Thermoleophilia bacterium]
AAELGADERFPNAVILPGLVNAHSHVEYATYAGFGDGLSFAPWIGMHVERKARLDDEDVLASARLGVAECLRSGVTTIGDCSFAGATAPACAALGLRAIVYLEVFGGADAVERLFEPARERIEGSLSERVRLGISPHAPYTVTPELYEAALGLGLPVATHLSESADEAAYVHDGTGPWAPLAELLVPPLGGSGIRALAERGLLGDRLLAVHCVTVDDEEIALLAAHDVAVAHCPRSNAQLGCGIAPLGKLRAAGVRLAIATDSPASTPSLDLFEELRVALWLQRARDADPSSLTAADALWLATLGGARALGIESEVGSLVPGKWADLTVLSLDGSPFDPVEDPAVAVVLGGSPDRVLATLVAGETRYRRNEATWRDLTRAGRRARSRMLP